MAPMKKYKNIETTHGLAGTMPPEANIRPEPPGTVAPGPRTAGPSLADWQDPLPPMLSDFRVKGFVDWLEFEIELGSASQPRHVRAKLPRAWFTKGKAPFVEAVGESQSDTSTRFRFRVQDPVSAADLLMQFRKLDYLLPLAAPVRIVGMEVGIDLWPARPGADVVRMAEHLYRGLAEAVSDNHRITGEKDTRGTATSPKAHRRDNLRALAAQRTIFIGNAGDPVTQRIYAKDLARARYEVTLTNDRCPVSSLDELATFRFESLSRWFRWLTPDLERLNTPLLQAVRTSLTLDDHERRRRRHRRVHAFGTRADSALGKESVKALKRLSTAHARGWQSALTKVARLGGEHLLGARSSREIGTQAIDFVKDSTSLLNTNLPENLKTESGPGAVQVIAQSVSGTEQVVTGAVRTCGLRSRQAKPPGGLGSARDSGRQTGRSRRTTLSADLAPLIGPSAAMRPWLPFFLGARRRSYRATRAERTLLRALRITLKLPAWW